MNTDWQLDAQDYAERLNHIDTILPPCPTCDGKGEIWNDPATDRFGRHYHVPCPAKCIKGKVPIEQLVATYNAVHDENLQRTIAPILKELYPQNPDVVLGREARYIGAAVATYLRSVKP